MAGLSDNGLEIRTQPELQALMEADLAARFPGLNVRAGPIQQLLTIVSEELALQWETLGALYSAAYPSSASGLLLDLISEITGTTRRPATRSIIAATVTLAGSTTLPAGSIAAIAGDPDAQYQLVIDVTNAAPTEQAVSAVFQSIETGPVPAPSGGLTKIVAPVTGWVSVNNTAAGSVGRDAADDTELRLQRILELAGRGSGTLHSIRAAVVAIPEVLEAEAIENASATVDGVGRPPHSFEVVVWDDDPPTADEDEIAQAIFDKGPAGIEVYGVGDSGTAIDEDGGSHVVPFTRATALSPTVSGTVVLAGGTGAGWLDQAKAAIVARSAEYRVGETAYTSQLIAALLDVPGIVAVTALTIAGGASLPASYNNVIRVQLVDITLGT